MTERVIDLAGPKGYEHGWIYVGGPGLPAHNPFRAKGGKSRRTVVEAPKRARAKTAPPARGGRHEIEPRAAVRMKAAELRDHQARGSRVADAELNRRVARRKSAEAVGHDPVPLGSVSEEDYQRHLANISTDDLIDAQKRHPHPKVLAEIEKRGINPRHHGLTPSTGIAPGKTATSGDVSKMSAAQLVEHAKKGPKEHAEAVAQAKAHIADIDRQLAANADLKAGAPAHGLGKNGLALKPGQQSPMVGPRPRRKPSSTYMEYQAEKQAQDRRFENSRDGYRSKGKGKSAEELAYFGEGEHMGQGATEQRVTYKSFLERKAASSDPREAEFAATYKEARALGIRHAQDESDTAKQNSEYDALADGKDDASFSGGYTDGLIAGSAAKEKAAAKRAAPKGPQVVGTMANHDELVTVHRTNGKHRVKIDGRIHSSHDTPEEATAEAHTLVHPHRRADTEDGARKVARDLNAKQEQDRIAAVSGRNAAASEATADAHKASRKATAGSMRHADAADAHARAAEAHDALGGKEQAKHHREQAGRHAATALQQEHDRRSTSESGAAARTDDEKAQWAEHRRLAFRMQEGKASPSELRTVAHSKWTAAEHKTEARRLLEDKATGDVEREHMIARASLSGKSDAELAKMFRDNPLSSSPIPQAQKRALAQYARERLAARKSGTFTGQDSAELNRKLEDTKLPEGYRISNDPRMGPALHHNGKMIRTTSKGNEAALAAYAHDHARGDTSGHARTVQDDIDARRASDGGAAAEKLRVMTAVDHGQPLSGVSEASLRNVAEGNGKYAAHARSELERRSREATPGKVGDAPTVLTRDNPTIRLTQAQLTGNGSSTPSAPAAQASVASMSDAELQRAIDSPTASDIAKGYARRELSKRAAAKGRERPKGDAGAAPADGIRVEHSGDGTVVYGTERGDTAATSALKEQGFKWSRNLGGWYLPRSWGEATRDQRVKALQGKLGDRVSVERGDLARSGTAAEQQAERVAAAERNAESNTQRAARLRGEADAQFQRSHDATSGIPFGQPILVGHHSQRRHENAIAKSHAAMRRGVDASAEADNREQRAQSSAARARMETDPRAAARRLDRNEAEHRKIMRSLEATPAGEHHDRLDAMRRDLEAKNEADRATVAASGNGLGKHNVKPGDLVVIKGQAHVVTSTGSKNVKVLTSVGHLPYPYHQVQGHKAYDNLAGESTARLEALIEATGAPETYKAQARAIIAKRKG